MNKLSPSLAAVGVLIAVLCSAGGALAASQVSPGASGLSASTGGTATGATASVSATGTGDGTPPRAATGSLRARYVNPFADPRWEAGRVDMGMDWAALRRLPVVAVGDAVILGSDSHSPWPGKHLIWYRLTDGSHAGDVIYVAEHLTKLVPAGKIVRAGQQIAVALPGYPYIETGWADSYGSPRAYPCYKEGIATHSGREMARFLAVLGAQTGIAVSRVAARPAGKPC